MVRNEDTVAPAVRRSKTELLDEAMRILAEHGEGALKIETLCRRLGVTKGSFYHHFSSREDFVRQLLDHWVAEHTTRFIEYSRRAGDAREQVCALDNLVLEADLQVGVAIRAWAQRDPLARAYQERVDALRLDYLTRLYAEMSGDAAEAQRLAVMEYALFIGLRLIMPRPEDSLLEQLPGHWLTLVQAYLGKQAGEQPGANPR